MKKMILLVNLFALLAITTACAQSTTDMESSLSINADGWADNWFAFYLGEELVIEDSVSITTERSFNKESFTFNANYPLVLNIIAKDLKENETGLEYIGTNRQQMRDGGIIAQFSNESTGDLIAVTNSDWQCLVIQEAHLDKSCESSSDPTQDCAFSAQDEPEGWKTADFDTSAWSPATVYSAAAVDPKDGYDQVSWDPSVFIYL